MKVLFPKWSEISREERFFTSMLFHDIQKNPTPMTDLFISDGKLLLGAQTKIQDIGFEVCFFRDAAFAKLIERNQELEKQTFDLFLTLSEQHVIIIEAKAQQCFDREQMKNLSKAKTLMQARKWPKWPANKISIVALCSSLYSPGEKTKKVSMLSLLGKKYQSSIPPMAKSTNVRIPSTPIEEGMHQVKYP